MTTTETSLDNNPLLETAGLPRFDLVQPEHIVPAVRHVLKEAEAALERIEEEIVPTWEGLLEPLAAMDRPFEFAWGPVSHLLGVQNSPELRDAHAQVLGEVVQFSLRASQSKPIYDGLLAIKNSELWESLDAAQQRIIELKLRGARHAGVALEGEAKDRFNEVASELSQLSNDFSNNVLDATKAFALDITEAADTEGWPTTLRQVAAQAYSQANEEAEATPENGPWRITLDLPSFGPFMQHSRNRDQRREVYDAFISRASEGETDNTPLGVRSLQLKNEKATLLGFESFADLSLASKMAEGVGAVDQMYEELFGASQPRMRKEHEELVKYAAEHGQSETVEHADLAFWAERMREEAFGFTDDDLRPYFPMPRVLDGLFGLCERLFGIKCEQHVNEPSAWNSDVQYYNVLNEAGEKIAGFYLDPYSRPHEKRGGAWMDECLNRRWLDGTLHTPVVHLCCNGTPPVGQTPSLMSFREVETLFHEFGHGLQGMLTTVDYADAAGLHGIEYDAIELASQFMENWCYHKETLMGMTSHYESGEALPEDLFEKICAARTYREATQMMRQLELGMTDLRLHHDFDVDGELTPFELHRKIAQKTSPMGPSESNRFLNAFTHIFAGGYAAGYYVYKWSQVLSADAFGAFEDVGLDDADAVAQLGRKYRDTILAEGGSRHPMEVFRDFRGREPSTEALLRHSGLVD